MKRIALVFLAFLSIALWATPVATASTLLPAYTYGTVNLYYGNSYGITQTAGFFFVPTVNVVMYTLGFFDYFGDGLGESHEVGIFDSSGTLLSSAVVPAGTASRLEGGFRYVAIPPLTLNAGETYMIAGFVAT